MAKRRMVALFLFSVFCLLKFSDQETILKKSNSKTTAAIAEAFIWSEVDKHGFQSLLPNIRSGVFDKYLNTLDGKEYNRTKSWIYKTADTLSDLISEHMADIPSEEFLRNNPNHEGLFNVSLTPEKSFLKQFLINLTGVRNSKDARDVPHLAYISTLPGVEPRTVKYLLDNGVDVNAKAYDAISGLMAAAESGNLPVVKLLIEKGANVNDGFGFPRWLVHVNSFYAYIKIFSNKKHTAPYNSKVHTTPLAIAVSEDHIEVVKYLLDHGADPNVGNLLLSFPPEESKGLNFWNFLDLLLEYGLSVNATDGIGQTILHKTVAYGDLEKSKLLLTYKTDVRATDYFGWTPLHFAALYPGNDSKSLINLLLDNGGDINAETDGGFSPLNLLEAGRDKSFLKYLKNYLHLISSNLSVSRQPGETNSQPELVRLFLDRGANVDHQDHLLGWSTLHWAAAIGDTPAVKLLVEEYRANVTRKSKMGWTPSYTAKHFNMTEIFEYLAKEEITHTE